ncbi:LLM class flavin-dependent oxidoreductase [Sediminibacter sp. Hel_I_10]|uniref:LLM class flavin-dependent oxidoreductase n=1 Tax=Sediminibacter sp. Hel_I_10 TaxID=1392490 RepID=UPI000478DD25|nr:LLM class flavin-dependent oxidoreductase [Sediminibacter sp. Hel_I_10]
MNTQTAYSILDLAIVSQGQSLPETFDHSLALAQAADSEGYKRYWLAEHHNSDAIASSATSILIGKIAEGTKRIKVGSGGIMLPNHSPLIVAEQFGTLGILYPDRIDLGLGRAPGTDRETANAIRSDFYQAAMSFPDEVQKIQNYFSSDNATEKVRATVAEGVSVPLYILGSSTDSAHLAAKKGLPYAFASHFATAQLMEALAIYRNEFKASEVLDQPYTMAGVNIIIADTDEEAERISTSLYRMIIGLLTGKRGFMQAPTEMTEDLSELRQHPSVLQMLKYSFIGSKQTVKQEIEAFLEKTQVDELIAVTNIYDGEDRIKSYRLFAEIMRELNQD